MNPRGTLYETRKQEKSCIKTQKKAYNENAHKSQGFSEVLQNFLPNLI